MNQFLQTRAEVNECTQWIKDNGYIPHGIQPKDFDLRHILPEIKPTDDVLDMGSCGSFVLYNLVHKGYTGLKYGVDIAYPENYVLLMPPDYQVEAAGTRCFHADLMNTGLPDKMFDVITCLSVIEHEVDFEKLAAECSRLLKDGGRIYLSFDYWHPKIDTAHVKLFDRAWNILDGIDVVRLTEACFKVGLKMDSVIDWALKEAVITPQFCSPANVSYTFGLLKFVKG
jgi:SAM-dependent methyltransferase